ncbi:MULTISPECIES: CBO0543 family protein [Pelosinus]|jgi:hypothetical protein|uniref:Transmembrane protein n=1 Tax=Pelosinus fermentans B4 TaxID=1149862 RepID=I8RGR0_9FIRM|nr:MULTISPECIES: CBO0543 family protein [Pelosinus]MDF2571777.1 hypothetical protein [Sporomusa sp.]EIW18818.1 hypothetical protein FB4_0343 [Pelosinus fermentans B4]EIW21972.1 hypothetical protein FA11_0779 [Pelosinus fermentans A11]OAM95177.1 hypothetical protein FR7_03198 [Pelosinus fermentans DSM 17108]SDR24366.1 hypothetical protein SAMN04515679_3332 [Pelosinus fermentans]
MEESLHLINEIMEVHAKFIQLNYDHWLHYEFYTWQWWVLMFILIVPWFIWLAVLDKKKVVEIFLYGQMIFLFTTGMDAIGVTYRLWYYPIKVSPKLPHIFPLDSTVLPIIYMIIYQHCPRWPLFLKATIVMAAVFAFIGEPLVERMGFYTPLNWLIIYSFPIYIIIGVVCKKFIDWLVSIRQKHER